MYGLSVRKMTKGRDRQQDWPFMKQANYDANRQAETLLCSFDARSTFSVAGVAIVLAFTLFAKECLAADSRLAVINAGVSSAEDAPFAPADYRFLPGDYVYFTFEIAGFSVHSEERDEIRKISLQYEVAIEDKEFRPLAAPISGEIKTDLSPEDKNWVPKRRASFLLPSFLAAGSFQIRVTVKDRFSDSTASKIIPFAIGGMHVDPATSITVENFRFLRSENDTEPLSVPAYSPGDTVFARFEMTGFRIGDENRHHVAYGITVSGPDGKAFINDPVAADLDATSFYPAQYIPGNITLNIDKNSHRGQYVVLLKVRDLLSNQELEKKAVFSIE
jgi:hypothetical protein